MVFHWSLSDSKPPQLPRTTLIILPILVVLWSKRFHSSFNLQFSQFLLQVLGNWSKSLCLHLVSLSLSYSAGFSALWRVTGISPSLSLSLLRLLLQVSLLYDWFFFFLLIKTRSTLVVWIRWTVCISRTQYSNQSQLCFCLDGLKNSLNWHQISIKANYFSLFFYFRITYQETFHSLTCILHTI